MKKYIAIIAFIALSQGVQANPHAEKAELASRTLTYNPFLAAEGKDGYTNYGFELMNKTDKNVTLTIINESLKDDMHKKLSVGMYTVVIPAHHKMPIKLDTKYKTLINIQQGKLIKYFSFPEGKTIYVTWRLPHDGSSTIPSLFPQSGPGKGLLGRTNSNFSLKHNVKASDILEQQPVQAA